MSTAGLPHAHASTQNVCIEAWPREKINDAEDRWLKDGLIEAMSDLRMQDLFTARPRLFRDLEHLVVARDLIHDIPVAALGSSWSSTSDGDKFLHITVQFVAPSLRSRDVFPRTWLQHLATVVAAGGFPALAALKTFNPIAYCGLREYGRMPGVSMYPTIPSQHSADVAIRATAARIAARVAPRCHFDPQTGVIHGAGVPRDLYRERPQSHDDEVDAYFETNTAPGDRILCVLAAREKETVREIMEVILERLTTSKDLRQTRSPICRK